MMLIREVEEKYKMLADMAEEGDIDPQTLKDTLECVDSDLEQAAEATAVLIEAITSEAEMVDKEIKRLQAKKKSLENNADMIKKELFRVMKAADKPKIKSDYHSFYIRKNAPSLDNVDSFKVPDEFMVVTKTVNRTELLKAVKANPEAFEGIASIKQTESLVIK